MELLPLGPVVITDTPGIDDTGELGRLRIQKSLEALKKTDIAVIACDSGTGLGNEESELVKKIKELNIPFVLVMTKSDLTEKREEGFIYTSTKTGENIEFLKENNKTCPIINSNVFERCGLIADGKTQMLPSENIKIFSEDFFCPKNIKTGKKVITGNTHTIHHYSASWHTKKSRRRAKIKRKARAVMGEESFDKARQIIKKIIK